MTAGYDGSENEESSKIPPPTEASWLVEIQQGHVQHPEVVFARLIINGEACGFFRLPNMEYLKWLRQMIQR